MKSKVIRDPVHGYINIDEKDLRFIDSLTFQRLRRIKQSGCYTVYPSANHTRFEHSIGVMHLGSMAFDSLLNKLTPEEKSTIEPYKITVRYACLLHDVGHAPLSHTGEIFFDLKELKNQLEQSTGLELPKGAAHEYLSCIIAWDVFRDLLEELNVDKELFCRMITGNTYPGNNVLNGLVELLNSSIDVDRLDYFIRDSFSSGTGNTLVSIDKERLIRSYCICQGSLCFDTSALSVVGNFVYARNTLYMWVYNHHVTIYTDGIAQQFLNSIFQRSPEMLSCYFSIDAIKNNLVDDTDIFALFKKYRNDFQEYYLQVCGRQYFKTLWKNQFQLKELFGGKEAQFLRFIETDPQVIKNDLIEAFPGQDKNKLFVFKANYKFSKPRVFIQHNGNTIDFQSFYRSNIYSNLNDTIPMVYVHQNDIEKIKAAFSAQYLS